MYGTCMQYKFLNLIRARGHTNGKHNCSDFGNNQRQPLEMFCKNMSVKLLCKTTLCFYNHAKFQNLKKNEKTLLKIYQA